MYASAALTNCTATSWVLAGSPPA